jgi:nicotinamide mononucleotide transporter
MMWIKDFIEVLIKDYIEIIGVITSILFTVFSIKQKPIAWIFGLFSAISYAVIFYQSKLYAEMALQGYYFMISIYGWFYWIKGKQDEPGKQLPVQKVLFKLFTIVLIVDIAINLILWLILRKTNSEFPFMDSFITSISIVATWLLARKFLESWILWIVIDIIAIGFYLYLKLYPTTILFIIYSILAIIGYFEWKKDYRKIS